MANKYRELNKKDWQRLFDYGLTNDPDGPNGFTSTTKKADDLGISKIFPTFIKLGKSSILYRVMYHSGCFYPMWDVFQHGSSVPKKEEINIIKKDNGIHN